MLSSSNFITRVLSCEDTNSSARSIFGGDNGVFSSVLIILAPRIV